MKVFILVAIAAIVVGLALQMEPMVEEPKWIPFDEEVHGNFYSMTLRFPGGDNSTMLTGHLYLPITKDSVVASSEVLPPVVVMAQGFGLVQSSGLMSYITAFQSHGMAVFTMDYATFGESDGLPRHTVCARCQVADIMAAIQMISDPSIKTTNGLPLAELIDAKRIGLWGFSLGGGHVLETAASLSNSTHSTTATSWGMPIKAVIAQEPYLTESEMKETSMLSLMKGWGNFFLGMIRWQILQLASQTEKEQPMYLPLVGLPGSSSVEQISGTSQGFFAHVAPNPLQNKVGWTNAATMESVVNVASYRPLDSISKIPNDLPVLLISSELDTICPAKHIHDAYETLHSKAIRKDFVKLEQVDQAGHYDIYAGKPLEKAMSQEISFFRHHLF